MLLAHRCSNCTAAQVKQTVGTHPAFERCLMNKVEKVLVEIVFFMAGMLIYQVGIFGKENLNELNRKLAKLVTAMQDAGEDFPS